MALRRQSSDFPVKCKKPKSYDHKITTLDELMTSAISIIKMMVHIYIQRNVINKQQQNFNYGKTIASHTTRHASKTNF